MPSLTEKVMIMKRIRLTVGIVKPIGADADPGAQTPAASGFVKLTAQALWRRDSMIVAGTVLCWSHQITKHGSITSGGMEEFPRNVPSHHPPPPPPPPHTP